MLINPFVLLKMKSSFSTRWLLSILVLLIEQNNKLMRMKKSSHLLHIWQHSQIFYHLCACSFWNDISYVQIIIGCWQTFSWKLKSRSKVDSSKWLISLVSIGQSSSLSPEFWDAYNGNHLYNKFAISSESMSFDLSLSNKKILWATSTNDNEKTLFKIENFLNLLTN